MKNKLLLVGLALFLLSSCGKHRFNGGPITTEDRSLTDSISGITVYGSFDVFITQSSDYEVRIEAGENLMPYIETRVDNNVLIIDERTNQYINDQRKRVYVSAGFLNNIKLKGSGDIQCSGLAATSAFVELDGSGDIMINYTSLNNITVDLDGSGNVTLTGDSDNTNLELRGSGDIKCQNLHSDNCYVDLEGSGNVKITVFDNLTVNLDGSGNVYYWGNPPNVNTNVMGSGNIVKM